MKITFLKNTNPVKQTGHSFYEEGAQADLPDGQWLIDSGYAREGWEPVEQPDPVSTLDQMSDEDLRELAKERGVSNYWNMKRETLIERLNE